ncbi:MAG: hypothetical protein GC168_10105 [Candidatus Hydrogenedens sp.]|nr:hypothetical protein [Candidatus Hydrogenedens sp.]
MSVDLTLFNQWVDQYQLHQSLPYGFLILGFILAASIVFRLVFPRTEWLGLFQGLLGAFVFFLGALSLAALAHVNGAAWDAAIRARLLSEPVHWYGAVTLIALHVGLMVAGVLKPRDERHPLNDFFSALQGCFAAMLVVGYAAFFFAAYRYWYPMWAAKLHFVVPTASMLVVGLSCLSYTAFKWFPKLFYTNYVQQAWVLVLLSALSFLSIGNYFDWGNWRYGAYVNAYEFYHYYIGAKYSPEVGYFGMYEATIVADQQDPASKGIFNGSGIRNLHNGRKESEKLALARSEEIKGWFSDERWQEFLTDIRWFKDHLVASRFSGMIGDKGYNATPVWTMIVGGGLSEAISTTDPAPGLIEYPMNAYRGFMNWVFAEPPGTPDKPLYPGLRSEPDGEPNGMLFLALIDQLMIIAALIAVGWAFGPRAVLLMIIVLGTSYVMKFSHMKGAYLRTDFCMALIIGICMMKKNHYGWAGMFVAYSFLSRVFPAVFFFGAGAKLVWHTVPLVPAFVKDVAKRMKGLAGFAAAITCGYLAVTLVLWAGLRIGLPSALSEVSSMKIAAGALAVLAAALLAKTALWGWYTNRLPRRYLWLFSTATATVVLMNAAAFLYHTAAKPDHRPALYTLDDTRPAGENPDLVNWLWEKLGTERTWKHDAWDAFARRFDGGLIVYGEYAAKIGKHNEDISPWRVGLKYWFIGEGQSYPFWAGFQNVYDAWVADTQNGVSTPKRLAHFASNTWTELNADQADPEAMQAGSYERIKNRATLHPGMTLTEAAWKEFETNKPRIRSAILTASPLNQEAYKLIEIMALVLCFFLVAGLKDWEATAWGFVVVLFLVSATYYYFILMLVPLLFFSPKIDRPSRAIGVLLILLFAWPGYYMNYIMGWKQGFPTYYYHTVMYFILVFYMMALAGGDTAAAAWRLLRERMQRPPAPPEAPAA